MLSFFATFYQTLNVVYWVARIITVSNGPKYSISIAFHRSYWNVGTEGHHVLGMLDAVCVVTPSTKCFSSGKELVSTAVLKLAAILLGGALGALWSLIPGLIKVLIYK
ncbi:MAG: hypothetical protein QW780_06020 [Sulfolobales archaeon]